MKFYSICPSFYLRGWMGAPHMLVGPQSIRKLDKKEFDTLILCDGLTDIEIVSSTINSALLLFEKEGIVVCNDQPHPIDKKQYYHYYDNRYMPNIIWSITGRCNYRCRHCYLDAPNALMGEMSHETALSIIDQMADCGIQKISITGGEPFVRKDFWSLIDKFQKYGITIQQIYTNGSLLREDILDQFSDRNMRPEFSISFDGVNGWHDWLRGVEGAEEDTLKALYLCRDKGFPTSVETCLHRGNRHVIRDTVNKLASTGVEFIKFGDIANTDLWKRNAQGNEMTAIEYVEAVLDYLPCYYEDGMPVDILFGSVVQLEKESVKYNLIAEFDKGTEECLNRHLCGSARLSCYIAPDGRLLPCMPFASAPEQYDFPKIQEIGLKHALNDSYYMSVLDRRVRDLCESCETCRDCPYLLKCGGGCRASAALHGECNMMGPDLYMCTMWKEGYVQKVHEVCDAAIAKYCSK